MPSKTLNPAEMTVAYGAPHDEATEIIHACNRFGKPVCGCMERCLVAEKGDTVTCPSCWAAIAPGIG